MIRTGTASSMPITVEAQGRRKTGGHRPVSHSALKKISFLFYRGNQQACAATLLLGCGHCQGRRARCTVNLQPSHAHPHWMCLRTVLLHSERKVVPWRP